MDWKSKIKSLKSYLALPALFALDVFVGILITTVIWFLFHVHRLESMYQVYMIGSMILFGLITFSVVLTIWLIIYVVGEILVR